MNEQPSQGGSIILISLLVALLLTVVPLPFWAQAARPEWTALVLLYWVLALPERVGVGVAWVAGFFQDALLGTLLGQHALAFALICYLVLRFHKQIRPVPVWQQSLVVLGLLMISQMVVLWVNGLIGRPAPGWEAAVALVIGAALWPMIFHTMRSVRRRFNVQ